MTVAVVAQFDRTDEARDAMLDLETKGIDADAINIVDRPAAVPTKEATRGGELSAGRYFARGAAKGAVIGAVVGAVIVVIGVALVRPDPLGVWLAVGAVAGAVGGAQIGPFLGVEARLPVNPDALDTFEIDPSDAAGVAVEVRVEGDDEADAATNVLRKHHPRHIERTKP